jgi:DNA-binding transcriptional MocR family regulator
MDDFLYEQVSDKLEQLIRNGSLKTGDKLPSIRALSQEQGISLSTAYKAYSQLETKGLVEARTKSGYYIRYSPRALPSTPSAPGRTDDGKALSYEALMQQLQSTQADQSFIHFSRSAPSPQLLPMTKLRKTIIDMMRTDEQVGLGYDLIQGNKLLREQLALQAFHWGGSINASDIVTTHGCLEAITLCLLATTQPGDYVLLESPTYFGFLRICLHLGLNIIDVPGHPETGIDMVELEAKLNDYPVAACLLVTSFTNPLGSLMPDEQKKKLVMLLEARNVPLIEDDVYGDLYFGAQRPKTAKSFDLSGNVMLCSSFSKSLAPGYRVGWCIPGRHLSKVIQLKSIRSLSSTQITHQAIGHFLAHHRFDLHMRTMRKALHTQCLTYTEAITRYFPPDVRVSQPKGGFVLWVEMNTEVHSNVLLQTASEEKINFSPGPLFSLDQSYAHCMRISFGQPFSAEVDRALRILGKLVRQATPE